MHLILILTSIILLFFLFLTIKENFDSDPTSKINKSSRDTYITTPGYNDIFNDVVYYPNKYSISIDPTHQITDKIIKSQQLKTSENKSDVNEINNTSSKSSAIQDGNNNQSSVSLNESNKSKTEQPLINNNYQNQLPNNDDAIENKYQSSLIGKLIGVGIYDCLKDCNGSCVEYGISGNAYCFRKIPLSGIKNLDRISKKYELNKGVQTNANNQI
jgi:hypothetical protein